MFFHLYKYRIKSLLRGKVIMFWSLLFPILLGTLFYFGFGSNIGEEADFDPIPAALVTDTGADGGSVIAAAVKAAEYSPGKPMFDVQECSRSEAAALLRDKKVSGILEAGREIRLTVGGKGMDESILKQFADAFQRSAALYGDVAAAGPEALEKMQETAAETAAYIREVSLGGEKQDSNLQFFYALIAMACMYASFVGLQNADDLQANNSALGARRMVSPANYLKTIVADMLAAFTLSFIEILIVWMYLRFVLGLMIGSRPVLFLLVCFLGCMIGVSMGQFIGSIARGVINLKIGLLLTISMLCSFLSGLMFGDMKYIVDQNAPVVNRINPAALITESFYCLTVYDDYSRFALNLATLAVIAALLTLGSFLAVRRAKYVSI